MARPTTLPPPKSDPKAELLARLERAPAEHAQSILAAYDLLDSLHNRGALDLFRGVVKSQPKLLELLVEAANSPESIRGLRNLVQLVNMLGAIDPDSLRVWARVIPDAMEKMTEPTGNIGLFKLLRQFRNPNVRRGIAAVNTLLETLGRGLSPTADKNGKA
jgi:uncharacterized protein YjgD (DUF1641 family)